MNNSPITREPSTLPPPPELEDAKEVPAGKTISDSTCCFVGSFCGFVACAPLLVSPIVALGPMALFSGGAAVLYKREAEKRIAEREVNQRYLETIHRYLKNQPELSSLRVQTIRQEPPSEPADV